MLYVALVEKEAHEHRAARTDALTGLGNRTFLFEQLGNICKQEAPEGCNVLLLLDLNNFKRVNDTRGHATGDELIRQVGRRLRQRLPDADIVRLGGDEFAILAGLPEQAHLDALCISVSQAVRVTYIIAGQDTFVGASLGATLVNSHVDPSELMRRADIAMYEAKVCDLPYRIFGQDNGGDDRTQGKNRA